MGRFASWPTSGSLPASTHFSRICLQLTGRCTQSCGCVLRAPICLSEDEHMHVTLLALILPLLGRSVFAVAS